VVNALGSYLIGEEIIIDGRKQKITRGEPFQVLNHKYFGLRLSRDEIKKLKESYRNGLTHNAIIEVEASLVQTPDSQAQIPFTFTSNKVQINVGAFHRLVVKTWERFPKSKIESRAGQYRTP
jgi:hypothetical protein